MSVTMSSSTFPAAVTAGLASEFTITMRDASANVVDCNTSALTVWLTGTGYAAAAVTADNVGACRVTISVLKVRAMM